MNSHETKVMHSFVADVLSALWSMLTKTDENQYGIQGQSYGWVAEYLAEEPSLMSMPWECLMLIDERHDLDIFLEKVNGLSTEEKRYILMGSFLSFEEHQLNTQNEEAIIKIAKEKGINDIDKYIELYKNPETLFNDLILMIKQIQSNVPNLASSSIEQCNKIKEELEHRHPLSLSQELMGKNFYNICDWQFYEFIVLPGLTSTRVFRFMDRKRQILFIGIGKDLRSELEIFDDLTLGMKAISDPTRLKMLKMIYDRPTSGKNIAQALGLRGPTVSHHLDIMRQVSLIHEERDGNTKYFSVNRKVYMKILRELKNYVSE